MTRCTGRAVYIAYSASLSLTQLEEYTQVQLLLLCVVPPLSYEMYNTALISSRSSHSLKIQTHKIKICFPWMTLGWKLCALEAQAARFDCFHILSLSCSPPKL